MCVDIEIKINLSLHPTLSPFVMVSHLMAFLQLRIFCDPQQLAYMPASLLGSNSWTDFVGKEIKKFHYKGNLYLCVQHICT